MHFQTFITSGKAIVTTEGLRCGAPRSNNEELRCNKMLCKKNKSGQMAGSFKCERCGQLIEVESKGSAPSPVSQVFARQD